MFTYFSCFGYVDNDIDTYAVIGHDPFIVQHARTPKYLH